jgi:hypothetical protein
MHDGVQPVDLFLGESNNRIEGFAAATKFVSGDAVRPSPAVFIDTIFIRAATARGGYFVGATARSSAKPLFYAPGARATGEISTHVPLVAETSEITPRTMARSALIVPE